MYALAFAALAVAPAQPPAKHEEQNPLLKQLIDTGIDLGGKEKIKFPTPTMPDGLNAAQQKAIIDGLIKTRWDFKEFTRDSVVAPQHLTINRLPGGDPKAAVRSVEVWFVVHGNFKNLEDDKFLDKLMNTSKGATGKGRELNQNELMQRKIKLEPAKVKRESYGTIEFDFLDKVRLRATGHAMWSRTGESVVAVAQIDPRFNGDKEFPNEWSPIEKQGGAVKAGAPSPWSGAALYIKVTKLQEPAGAMFVEQHVIYVEPQGWFDGQPILTSKLPLAVRDNVQTMRKEFQKAK
jgi:hypothetical protein